MPGIAGEPIVFDKVEGAYCYDVDGNKYIDYVGSVRAQTLLLLLHRHLTSWRIPTHPEPLFTHPSCPSESASPVEALPPETSKAAPDPEAPRRLEWLGARHLRPQHPLQSCVETPSRSPQSLTPTP